MRSSHGRPGLGAPYRIQPWTSAKHEVRPRKKEKMGGEHKWQRKEERKENTKGANVKLEQRSVKEKKTIEKRNVETERATSINNTKRITDVEYDDHDDGDGD